MGGGPSPPPVQDPGVTASTQLNQYSIPAAEMSQAGSMVNQFNPYGNVQYQQTGVGPNGVPIYSSNVELSPQQQALFNSYFGSQAAAGQGGLGLLQNANYGAMDPSTAIGMGSSGITGALTNQWLTAQAPWMKMQNSQLDTQLRNQGLNPSPTATGDPSTWGPYEKAMAQLNQSQSMAVAGAVTQFQPQAFQEATSLYNLPAQLGTALASFGMSQSPTGQLIQTPMLNIGAPNYEGDVASAQQMQMQEYQAQLAQQSSMMQGLFGLGGNILGAGILKYSDRRLKEEIKKIIKLAKGVYLYAFKYKGSDRLHHGVMADEIEKIMPEAVVQDSSIFGYKAVNYSLIKHLVPEDIIIIG